MNPVWIIPIGVGIYLFGVLGFALLRR